MTLKMHPNNSFASLAISGWAWTKDTTTPKGKHRCEAIRQCSFLCAGTKQGVSPAFNQCLRVLTFFCSPNKKEMLAPNYHNALV